MTALKPIYLARAERKWVGGYEGTKRQRKSSSELLNRNQENFMNNQDINFEVHEPDGLHNYRTEIPNIIFSLGLDPYEFSLYCMYKKIAGDRGACLQSNKTLLTHLKMSERKMRDVKKSLAMPRSELGGKSLIQIQECFNPDNKGREPDLIVITEV